MGAITEIRASIQSEVSPDPLFPITVAPGVVIKGVSKRARAVESYNRSLIAEKIGQDAALKIEYQERFDAQYDLFTPYTSSPQRAIEYSPLGELEIGKLIYQGLESTIYTIIGFPDLLIKYQANCDEIRDSAEINEPVLHPILTDYWYASEATRVGLAPDVVFVSPPAFLCREPVGRCAFLTTPEKYMRCFENWGTVRYMIMRKLGGQDLFKYRSQFQQGIIPVKDALRVGAAILEMLKRLHLTAKIAHGDIHSRNIIALHEASEGNNGLVLVDFGRAFRLMQNQTNAKRYPRGRYRHFLYTHWQYEGFQVGARDDVMKAVQVVAQLMNPLSYMDYENFLTMTNPIASQSFKTSGFIFVRPPFQNHTNPYDPVALLAIPEESKDYLKNQLGWILQHVRNLTDVNQLPNYDELITVFEVCRRVAMGEDIPSTTF